MTFALVLLGIALAISLAFNLGLVGAKAPTPANPNAPQRSESRASGDDTRKLEAELEKKARELSELKKAHSDAKDELKTAKKKLFDLSETNKAGDDLAKARAEVERSASIQLDATRAELATALSEIQRLKADADNKGKKRAPVEAAAPAEKKEEAPKPQEVITRVIRELNDVEKERIAKLEAQSSADRKKANELDRELKSLKAKLDRHQRDSKAVFKDAELARDKFRAVEIRLNRTIVENDLLKRAIKDVEKKAGLDPTRIELTAEEIAQSDATVKAKHVAEDKAEADARAKLEAAPATTPEEAPAPAAAEAAPAAEATPTAQA